MTNDSVIYTVIRHFPTSDTKCHLRPLHVIFWDVLTTVLNWSYFWDVSIRLQFASTFTFIGLIKHNSVIKSKDQHRYINNNIFFFSVTVLKFLSLYSENARTISSHLQFSNNNELYTADCSCFPRQSLLYTRLF